MSGERAKGRVTGSQQQAVYDGRTGRHGVERSVNFKKDKHTYTNASKRERKDNAFHKATSAAEALECTGARIIDIVYTGSSPEAKGREKTRVGQAWSGSEKVAKSLRVRNKERKAKQARQHEQQSHARRCIRAVVSDAGAPSPR